MLKVAPWPCLVERVRNGNFIGDSWGRGPRKPYAKFCRQDEETESIMQTEINDRKLKVQCIEASKQACGHSGGRVRFVCVCIVQALLLQAVFPACGPH